MWNHFGSKSSSSSYPFQPPLETLYSFRGFEPGLPSGNVSSTDDIPPDQWMLSHSYSFLLCLTFSEIDLKLGNFGNGLWALNSHRIVMILFPHNREFRYRRHVFLGVTGISVFLAGITSGLNLAPLSAGIGIAAVVAAIMYFYSAWITRFDLRFRYVHPRKIRFTSLLTFYLPLVISALLLVASPWAVQQPWLDTPDSSSVYISFHSRLIIRSSRSAWEHFR